MAASSAPVAAPAPALKEPSLGEKLFQGAVAGVIGTLIIFPIDTIKTHMMKNGHLYDGPIDCARKLIAKNGYRGMYKGLAVNLIGVTPEKAIKLGVNDYLRTSFKIENAEKGIRGVAGEGLTVFQALSAGGIAGTAQCIATNPMEMMKIRYQLAANARDEAIAKALAKGLPKPDIQIPTIPQLVRRLGVPGLYQGTVATLLRDVPFSMMFFPLYGYSKERLAPQYGTWGTLAAGTLSGAFAAGAVTPMDVIKTKLQAEDAKELYSGIQDCARKTYAEGGMKAFFSGVVPRAFVVGNLFGISLLCFEVMKKFSQ